MKFFIKEIRHQRNLSVNKLSDMARVGRATISDTENGKRVPCLGALCKIARALGVDVRDLFEPEEKDYE